MLNLLTGFIILYLSYIINSSQVFKYLRITEEDEISWALIQAAVSSIAQTTIITMQDVLGLDSSARMNIPATQVNIISSNACI